MIQRWARYASGSSMSIQIGIRKTSHLSPIYEVYDVNSGQHVAGVFEFQTKHLVDGAEHITVRCVLHIEKDSD